MLLQYVVKPRGCVSMKNIFLLLLLSFWVTACASAGYGAPKKSVGSKVDEYVGSNFDEYVMKKGVPSSQYVLQNGNTVYSIKESCGYSNSVGYREKSVTVDSQRIIRHISTKDMCSDLRFPD